MHGGFLKVIIQNNATGCVICLSNKVGYLGKEENYKILAKKLQYIVVLTDLCDTINILLPTISFQRHYNENRIVTDKFNNNN